MSYLTNMPETCRKRSTRPEHALDLLDSVKREFDKSFGGGIFDASYVLQKLRNLTRHVEWLEQEAEKERAAEYESESTWIAGDPADLNGLPERLDEVDE